MTSELTLFAAEGGHAIVHDLPYPPIMFGVIAIALFLAALALLWSFRNTLALDPHGIAEGKPDPDVSRGSSRH